MTPNKEGNLHNLKELNRLETSFLGNTTGLSLVQAAQLVSAFFRSVLLSESESQQSLVHKIESVDPVSFRDLLKSLSCLFHEIWVLSYIHSHTE